MQQSGEVKIPLTLTLSPRVGFSVGVQCGEKEIINCSNHNLGNVRVKWAGRFNSFRPMPFQQRTNTFADSFYCGHGFFTVDLSVFAGTPPIKPLNCKNRFISTSNALVIDKDNPPVVNPSSLSQNLCWRTSDVI